MLRHNKPRATVPKSFFLIQDNRIFNLAETQNFYGSFMRLITFEIPMYFSIYIKTSLAKIRLTLGYIVIPEGFYW